MKLASSLVLLFAALPALAADTVRVCTYNLLNYSLSNEDGRTTKFKMIMDSIRPDVLVCQEVVEAPAVAKFLAEALGSEYFSPTFHDGEDSDNALFIRKSKFTVETITYTPTALRDIAGYYLKSLSTDARLKIYSVHLKSSDTDEDAARREAEAQILYGEISVGIESDNIIVAGDCNFYGTTEAGYQAIAGVRAQPTLQDPLGSDWKRNDVKYISYYTQSPRVQPDATCSGGTDGGMDDRFDYIFLSRPMHQKMIPGSYTHFGNDGVAARFNSSINSPPNAKHSPEMAAALLCASDHLPVYCDVVLTPSTGVEEEQQLTGEVSPRYFDILGREVKEPVKGGLYLRMESGSVRAIVF